MSVLNIFLFGVVQIDHTGMSATANLTRTSQMLLAYLLLQRHRQHSRDTLAEQFWQEYSPRKARNCLNTALWRLRQVLEPEDVVRGTYLQTTSSGEISFNCQSNYWLDIAAFEEQIRSVLEKPIGAIDAAHIQIAENALQLYTGDLLEGFYDDWALRERERLRHMHLNILAHLMRYYEHHKIFDKSLIYGQQILDLDPLREEIHRAVMRLFIKTEQRVLAIRQYETCYETMITELNIPPMDETQKLYNQIMQQAAPQKTSSSLYAKPTSHQDALRHLKVAKTNVKKALSELEQAIQFVEHFSQDSR